MLPACKICAAPTAFFDRCDFHNNAKLHHGYFTTDLDPSGLQLPYYCCTACGFIFTPFMDKWGDENLFAQLVYNKDYPRIDGTYNGYRAGMFSNIFCLAFHDHLPQLEFLDYGGGIGLQSALVGAFGAKRSKTYDPFAVGAARPDGVFNVVSCIEVIEHAVDPKAMVADLVSFTNPDNGIIFLSTETTPPDIEQQKCKWWYVNPRVGHISFYPEKVLDGLFAAHGYKMIHRQSHTHIAYKVLPQWTRMLGLGENV
jgi:Methyltransferase domain